MLTEKKSWRFGVLSSAGAGHLNPLIALSQELKRRGHTAVFFDRPKIEARVRDAGLEFFPIGPPGRTNLESPRCNTPGIRHEIALLRSNLARMTRDLGHYLEKTPPALAAAGVDALLVDEIALTGPTIAQLMRLPYFLLSTSIPHRLGWKSSSWLTGYRSSETALSWLRGPLLEVSALRMRGPLLKALNQLRRDAGLGPLRLLSSQHRSLAHLTQWPQCLDARRKAVPTDLFYSGPWLSDGRRQSVQFPWHRLDGRPVAYVTLGTTRNAQPETYRMIAEACSDPGLDLQLVIALGDRFDSAMFDDLPGRPVVVRYAPQLELLKVAKLVIAHGGCNTSLEALLEGKPMVVIPLAYDQPAIAARLHRVGAAEVVPVMRLSADGIREAVTKVLNEPRYRLAAEGLRPKLAQLDGAKRAADIIALEMEGYAARQRVEAQAALSAAPDLAQAAAAPSSYHSH